MGTLKSSYRGMSDLDSPVQSAVAVTPSDTVDLTYWARALWVGGAGNVAVILSDDSAPVTFSAVPAGTLLPVVAKRVMAANTTATLILALF